MIQKIIAFLIALIAVKTVYAQDQVDFSVDIPDSWRLESYSKEGGLWVYESEDGKHRLSVSILYYSKEPNHSQQSEFLAEFVKTRKEQPSKLVSGTNFTEVVTKEYEGAWVAKFSEGSPNGRFAVNKSISSRIGIANFYFESFSSGKVHEEISDRILSTTGFAS